MMACHRESLSNFAISDFMLVEISRGGSIYTMEIGKH